MRRKLQGHWGDQTSGIERPHDKSSPSRAKTRKTEKLAERWRDKSLAVTAARATAGNYSREKRKLNPAFSVAGRISRTGSESRGAMTFRRIDSRRRLTVGKRKRREREIERSNLAFMPQAELKTRNVRETQAKLAEKKGRQTSAEVQRKWKRRRSYVRRRSDASTTSMERVRFIGRKVLLYHAHAQTEQAKLASEEKQSRTMRSGK